MNQRDVYLHDYTFKYHPKTSFEKYRKEMFEEGGTMLHFVSLSDYDADRLKQQHKSMTNYGIATLGTSIAVILAYNKIPGLNRIQGRWKKFAIKLGFFFLPINIVSSYGVVQAENLAVELYQKYFQKYQHYKQSGDIKFLNNKVIGSNE